MQWPATTSFLAEKHCALWRVIMNMESLEKIAYLFGQRNGHIIPPKVEGYGNSIYQKSQRLWCQGAGYNIWCIFYSLSSDPCSGPIWFLAFCFLPCSRPLDSSCSFLFSNVWLNISCSYSIFYCFWKKCTDNFV